MEQKLSRIAANRKAKINFRVNNFEYRTKLNMDEQETKLDKFIKAWSNKGSEVADKVTYWNSLLSILGVPQGRLDDGSYIQYEKKINWKQSKFHGAIDAYIPQTRVLIEQKSFGVDLAKPELRPNGGDKEPITPLQQAKRYNDFLPQTEQARFFVLSNFSEIWIYDRRTNLDAKPIKIKLSELKKQLPLLSFLVQVEKGNEPLEKEKEVSLAAGELVSQMYNELAKIFDQYQDIDRKEAQRSINALCVRLVFCLYAEDAKLFGSNTEQFRDYLEPIAPNRMGIALKQLFKVLDMNDQERVKADPFFKTDNPELSKFPYVNGGMFHDQSIIVPPFTPELKDILLNKASRGFNWSDISPTIFGAVFESTLNPETRRQGGMHYTSVKNIHKVIDPLFLDELKAELKKIKDTYVQPAALKDHAEKFQEKLANLTFFDPACGSGNFLTETYLSLRKLENEAIRIETQGASLLETGSEADKYIKVSIQNFYGIEINDFAVSVAKTALWIAEDQMMKKTQDLIYGAKWHFLPLKTYTNIHEGNALRMDWNKVVPNYACSYIISNPPFVGKKEQTKEQKEDLKAVFKSKDKDISVLDYVCGWYKKANSFIAGNNVQVAFVSTNSISQGEQVAPLWQHLSNISINFVWQTFAWDNEAKEKAHVHVVIIGFADSKFQKKTKLIFYGDRARKVKQISPYLVDFLPSDVVIAKHSHNIDKTAPTMDYGSMPIDKGNLILSKNDVRALVKEDKKFLKFVRPYGGGKEIINGKYRWCLWLKGADPTEYRKSSFIKTRVAKNKKFRESSGRNQTKKLAAIPYLFGEIRQPNSKMLVFPKVSSEKRKYIPIPFLNPNMIINGSSLLIPNANNYDFGILESSVHMDWMRMVAGRLEMRYQYSKELVYTNFPWPRPTNEQKSKVEKTAQDILNARKLYPDDSLADLYDPDTMPQELLKAHKANDEAVMKAYGFVPDMTESQIVAELFKMYEKLIKK